MRSNVSHRCVSPPSRPAQATALAAATCYAHSQVQLALHAFWPLSRSRCVAITTIRNDEYREWLGSIKRQVQASQIKAAVAVNYAMLEMYWFLGEQIIEKQQTAKWGDGFLKQMSQDLLAEFPEIKGFSYRNLRRMRQWCLFWTSSEAIWPQLVAKLGSNWPQAVAATVNSEQTSVQQLVAQIPWGHNSVIIEKLKTTADALFYVQKTIENNWSRAVLTHQIESGLHLREGKAVDNFAATLPKPESDLARQLLRE